MPYRTLISISSAILLILTSCSQHFKKVDNFSTECGYRSASFDKFVECMDERLESVESQEIHDRRPNRKANVKTRDQIDDLKDGFRLELSVLKHTYLTGRNEKTDDSEKPGNIYNQYDQLVLNFKNAEKEANDRATVIAAVVLVGAAAVVACKDGGCGGGGGGGSNTSNLKCDLQGCCSYHGGVQGVGLSGRVVCNDFTYSPTCKCP